MTITKLRELGYNKLADKAASYMDQGYTEDHSIVDSIIWILTGERIGFWSHVNCEMFDEAKKMQPELFEETKTVYNKGDLEDGDLVRIPNGALYLVTDIFTDKGFQLIHDRFPTLNLDSLDNEQILAVYKPNWEKPQEIKEHTLEELYKIVGYKFEIKE